MVNCLRISGLGGRHRTGSRHAPRSDETGGQPQHSDTHAPPDWHSSQSQGPSNTAAFFPCWTSRVKPVFRLQREQSFSSAGASEREVTGMPRLIVGIQVLIGLTTRAVINASGAIAGCIVDVFSTAPMRDAGRSHRLGTFGTIVECRITVRAEAHRTLPVALQSSHGEAPIIPKPAQLGHGSESIHVSFAAFPVTAA
jgi:hypothetical protein